MENDALKSSPSNQSQPVSETLREKIVELLRAHSVHPQTITAALAVADLVLEEAAKRRCLECKVGMPITLNRYGSRIHKHAVADTYNRNGEVLCSANVERTLQEELRKQ